VLLLPVLGCGTRTGSVSGTVTFKGAPLSGGSVTFHGENGKLDSAAIGPDGKYTMAQAPLGPVKAAVVTVKPSAPPTLPGGKETPKKESKTEPVGRFVPIPPKYHEPQTAGLHYTITSGDQTIDIKLEP